MTYQTLYQLRIRHLVQNNRKNYLNSTIYNLYVPMQSGYRGFHSTETSFIRIFYGLYCTLDEGKNVVLLLLNLSCAFDTLVTYSLLNTCARGSVLQGLFFTY